jgi:mono/diheme cytochrome c family protein
MFRSSIFLAAAAASLVAAVGCGKGSSGAPSTESQSSSPVVAIDAAQAKEIFNTRCAACHGTEGRGDGPGAAALNPKPRNYHDRAWQAKVTDADIRKTISYGGAAVGKSPMMPASPDLESKPEVIEGLLQIVRGFGKS